MDLSKLNETFSIFNEKIKDETEPREVLNLYERFYGWLIENIQKEEDEPTVVELHNALYRMLYGMINTISRLNFKCKDYSTKWNKHLIAKTYEVSKLPAAPKLKALMNALVEEKDFPTKAYCYQVLQQDGVVDFSTMIVNKDKPTVKLRPSMTGNEIEDDGKQYWHAEAKELMTYDQCTEKHLGHHMLMYASGDQKGLYVGFNETDEAILSAVKEKTISKETEEVLETVYC